MLKKIFLGFVAFVLASCSLASHSHKNFLRLNIYTEPPSLDSRKATDSTSANVLLMLFEGLTRIGFDHKPYPAAAEKIQIEDDGRTYIFKLRDTKWSNGKPVTSGDFLYAWQTILDPKFPGFLAYKLYLIQNAQAIKEGKLPMSALGVFAPDPKTLVVKLNHPTPYFLELIAFPTFYPIYKAGDLANPDWSNEGGSQYVSNGPFQLKKWDHENEIIATKNPYYWDANAVKLSGLHLSMIDDTTTEFYMFEMGELDWCGSPLSNLPPEFIPTLIKEHKAHFYPATATYFYKINTNLFPLNNINIRRALGLAINRHDIVTHITQAGQKPATALVPEMPGWSPPLTLFKDGDVEEAKQLFAKGLQELNLKVDQIPKLTLTYNTNREHEKIAQAIQHQWKEILGIEVELVHYDWKVYLSKIGHQKFDIARMAWVGDFHDPLSFLDPYKYKNDPEEGGNNDTGWESADYISLLNEADKELNLKKRAELLRRAETILIDDMPIIPIYYIILGYLKRPNLKDVYLSPLGIADFKRAHFDEQHR